MTYQLLDTKQMPGWRSVEELALFKIHPLLNFLTGHNLMNVKFR